MSRVKAFDLFCEKWENFIVYLRSIRPDEPVNDMLLDFSLMFTAIRGVFDTLKDDISVLGAPYDRARMQEVLQKSILTRKFAGYLENTTDEQLDKVCRYLAMFRELTCDGDAPEADADAVEALTSKLKEE